MYIYIQYRISCFCNIAVVTLLVYQIRLGYPFYSALSPSYCRPEWAQGAEVAMLSPQENSYLKKSFEGISVNYRHLCSQSM